MEKVRVEFEAEILDKFDTIVCGGGTAGVVAALAAARNGAKTLLLEAEYHLGGMLTMGNAGLTKYVMHGCDYKEQYEINKELITNPDNVQVIGGIPLELTHKLINNGDAIGNHGTGANYVYPDPHAFKILLFEELKAAGVKILLHSKIVKVIKEGNSISGVVFDTKDGHKIAYGKYIIDSTGDGDVAALAGAEYILGSSERDETVKEGKMPVGKFHEPGSMYRIGGVDVDKMMDYLEKNPEKFEIQWFGLMGMEEMLEEYKKGASIEARIKFRGNQSFQIYNNPRQGIIVGCVNVNSVGNCNGLIPEQLTEAEYGVLIECTNQLNDIKKEIPGFENAYILDVPKVGIRETRHIEGEYVINIRDILTNNDYEDTVALSSHPIDIYPKPAVCKDVVPPKRAFFRVPYRILVAKGFDNLILAGRHVSATREASGCLRPTMCCMVMGEAAGTAAAILSEKGGAAKNIDINLLRSTLKNNGVKC